MVLEVHLQNVLVFCELNQGDRGSCAHKCPLGLSIFLVCTEIGFNTGKKLSIK